MLSIRYSIFPTVGYAFYFPSYADPVFGKQIKGKVVSRNRKYQLSRQSRNNLVVVPYQFVNPFDKTVSVPPYFGKQGVFGLVQTNPSFISFLNIIIVLISSL